MNKISEAVLWLLANPDCDQHDMPDEFQGLHLDKVKQAIYRSPLLHSPRFNQFNSLNECVVGRAQKNIIQIYLDRLNEMVKRGLGLYLWSNSPGSGKTTVMKIIAVEILKSGRSVLFDSMVNIKNKLKAEFDSKTLSPLRTKLNMVDVLILDDLGSEIGGKWLDEIMKDIIDERYNQMKPLMITTNFPIEKLPFDKKIIDRLSSMLKPVHFPEKSFRHFGV